MRFDTGRGGRFSCVTIVSQDTIVILCHLVYFLLDIFTTLRALAFK